ncbi:MAG: hypothetical protein V1723_01000, partial [Candidatus Uhrbacteria bacterium]
MALLLATSNPGKIEELSMLLARQSFALPDQVSCWKFGRALQNLGGLGGEIRTLQDFPDIPDFSEDA